MQKLTHTVSLRCHAHDAVWATARYGASGVERFLGGDTPIGVGRPAGGENINYAQTRVAVGVYHPINTPLINTQPSIAGVFHGATDTFDELEPGAYMFEARTNMTASGKKGKYIRTRRFNKELVTVRD